MKLSDKFEFIPYLISPGENITLGVTSNMSSAVFIELFTNFLTLYPVSIISDVYFGYGFT